MKILVGVTSYGKKNDVHLKRLLREYRDMAFDVDCIIFSNAEKDLPEGVEVRMGLPGRDPWSLPFAHKGTFAECVERYDLFIYSEDDILITERNIRAFTDVTKVLPKGELAGFLRCETGAGGRTYFTDAQAHYHWETNSIRSRGGWTFASFTNDHSACYMLTQEQLRRAIASGGFVTPPHEGRYDLACSAATDPYTQCGFRKVICLSRLGDFIVTHLSNRYAGGIALEDKEFWPQVDALTELAQNSAAAEQLFNVESQVYNGRWSKSYYEPCQEQILSVVPDQARSVLSLGCGWGATEGHLVKAGVAVVGVPLDPIIGVCAKAKGVEIIDGPIGRALQDVEGRRFDCVLMSNVLHLVPDPWALLSAAVRVVVPGGSVIASFPNLAALPSLWRRFRWPKRYGKLRSFEESGLNLMSGKVVRRWFEACCLSNVRIIYPLPRRWGFTGGAFPDFLQDLLASEVVVKGEA